MTIMVAARTALVSAPLRWANKQPHIRALAMLHENYTWTGVRMWLKSPDVRLPGRRPRRASGLVLFVCYPTDVANFYDGVAQGVIW